MTAENKFKSWQLNIVSKEEPRNMKSKFHPHSFSLHKSNVHDSTFDKLLTDLFIRAQTWFLFIWKSSVEMPKVFTIRHPHKYVSRRQELTWSNISNSYTFNVCFIPNTYVQSVYAWLFVHHSKWIYMKQFDTTPLHSRSWQKSISSEARDT